jgi:hypothetical protein
MKGLAFIPSSHKWAWSDEEVKGYVPYLKGRELRYIILKCDVLKDWGVWSIYGQGDYICGGLTLKEAKESFTKFINE